MPRQTVERNIYFFRADVGKDDSGQLLPFDPTPALAKIVQLPFTDDKNGRYEDDSDGNVFCLFYDPSRPNEVQFCRIRRTGLPQLEDSGSLSELNIPPNTGLSEAVQIMFFPKNIVGMVYNHYGPRIPRLSSYLNAKANSMIPVVAFRALLNADVSRQLEEFEDVRLFELSIQPSYAEVIRQSDDSLGGIIDASIGFQGPDDVVHVVVKYSSNRRQLRLNKTLGVVKKLLMIDDLGANATRFRIRGKRRDTGLVDTIDLLSDRLISTQSIVRLSDRGRALDPDSAFRAIEKAYSDNRDELERAYSIY